jgi:hypothetical protein
VSPRTLLIPLAGVLAVLSGCGAPPQPQPKSPPPYTTSAAPGSVQPAPPLGMPLPTLTGYPTNPAYPTYPTATVGTTITTTTTTPPPPTTKSPTPTPSHAGRCTTEPTGAQILNLIKGKPGVPNATLRVFEGPFCSGTWSFATVEVDGRTTDQVEPLMVVTTGKGSTLALVAAGSEVCVARVQTGAPPGIRVLACGF